MQFKIVAAGCIAAVLSASPAMAQTSYNPDRLVKSVENADLLAIVNSLDHEVVKVSDNSDRHVGGRDENGLTYILIGTACDANGVSGCQGVNMQVRWSNSASVTPATLAEANRKHAAVTSWKDGSTLGFSRYVVLDHGISMANLRENVKVLLAIAPIAKDTATGNN